MEVVQLVLLASVAVAGVTSAIIAAWRLIPRPLSSEQPHGRFDELEEAVEAIRLSVIELADKYEVTIRRNNVRVGRLRRKVARLQGDEEDEDQDIEPAPELPSVQPSPCTPAKLTKAEMFAHYAATHPKAA